MLFRKKIARSCVHCRYGTKFDDDKILCLKKGVMQIDGKCRKFIYDPFKRIPGRAKALDFNKYDKEDYSL
jgi:hypothetical protein